MPLILFFLVPGFVPVLNLYTRRFGSDVSQWVRLYYQTLLMGLCPVKMVSWIKAIESESESDTKNIICICFVLYLYFHLYRLLFLFFLDNLYLYLLLHMYLYLFFNLYLFLYFPLYLLLFLFFLDHLYLYLLLHMYLYLFFNLYLFLYFPLYLLLFLFFLDHPKTSCSILATYHQRSHVMLLVCIFKAKLSFVYFTRVFFPQSSWKHLNTNMNTIYNTNTCIYSNL